MRTTLTLDPDVADALKAEMMRQNRPFRKIVNEFLRRGMALEDGSQAFEDAFRVAPHCGGFKPGVDLLKLNQLADDLEADAFVAEHPRRECS